MAYNGKMMGLPFEQRAQMLADVYKIDYGEASKWMQHDCLGGAFTFTHMSKKAVRQFNDIGMSCLLDKVIKCAKSEDYMKAYCLFRRVGLEKNGFILEHTIPCSIAQAWIEHSKDRQTKEAFLSLLQDKIFIQCGITIEEDFYLRNAGLNQKMPSSWNGNLDHSATFARYREVGIDVIDIASI